MTKYLSKDGLEYFKNKIDTTVVHNTTDETISGVKSFNSDPNINLTSTDIEDIVDSDIDSGTVIHNTGAQTISGVKTFTDGIVGNVTGTASAVPWEGVTDKPTAFTPASHTHTSSEVTDLFSGTNTWSAENSFNHANLNRKYDFTIGDNSYRISRIQYQDKDDNRWGVQAFTHDIANSVYYDTMISCLKNDGQTILSRGIRFLLRPDNTSEFSPLDNNVIDLGTSSKQWKSVNSQTYYYNGTQWGLDQNNTWTGDNTFSDTLTSADVVPSATDTYSLGSASVQYNAIYGKSYYYNGTQWGLDVANTWTVTQTFSANNTFSGYNTFSHFTPIRFQNDNIEKGVLPTNFQYQGILFRDKNSSDVAYIRHLVNQSGATNNVVDGLEFSVQNKFADGALDSTGTNTNGIFRIGFWTNGQKYIYNEFRWRSSLIPFNNQVQEIGASSYQWKDCHTNAINGVNPGALSLPSTTYTSIDTTDWNTTGSSNSYTPTLDGWVYVRITSGSGNYIAVKRGGSSIGYPCDTREGTALAYIALTVPVSSGATILIYINGTVEQCRFIPCLGNV